MRSGQDGGPPWLLIEVHKLSGRYCERVSGKRRLFAETVLAMVFGVFNVNEKDEKGMCS